ncbi:MAG TPA: hypothetical protein VFT69_18855 [Pseudolabrys sp.]|nr:hypothetical protein [Pseudolabrys sp.]
MAYTLDDLAEAQRAVEVCENRVDNHRRNNPNYGRADLRRARDHLDLVVTNLKRQGLIPLTPKEQLDAALNAKFPNAESKLIVTFEGKRYQRRYRPARRSLSGKTVMEWHGSWEPLADNDSNKTPAEDSEN